MSEDMVERDVRGTPEYATGYADGMHGRPVQWRYLDDACYQQGYAAGSKPIAKVRLKHAMIDAALKQGVEG